MDQQAHQNRNLRLWVVSGGKKTRFLALFFTFETLTAIADIVWGYRRRIFKPFENGKENERWLYLRLPILCSFNKTETHGLA